MKAFRNIMLAVSLTLGFGGISLPTVAKADSAAVIKESAADHLAMAAKYDEKSKAQQDVIDEHEKMKVDYKKTYYPNEKRGNMGMVQKMNRHCDAIIKDATKLKGDFDDFAKWHKMRAAELEGK